MKNLFLIKPPLTELHVIPWNPVTGHQRSLPAPPLPLTALSSPLSLPFFKLNRETHVTPLEVSLTDRGLMRAEGCGAGLLLSVRSDECPEPSESEQGTQNPVTHRARPGPAASPHSRRSRVRLSNRPIRPRAVPRPSNHRAPRLQPRPAPLRRRARPSL